MTNKAVVPFDSKVLPPALQKRFAGHIDSQRASTPSSGGIMPRIGVDGDQLVLPTGQLVDTLDVVPVVGLRVNRFFEGDFEPGNPQPPVCGAIAALGQHENDMAPHEGWSAVQSPSCTGCPRNERGRGVRKECRNGVDVAVIHADSLSSVAKVKEAPIALVQLSATSIRNWAGTVEYLAANEPPTPTFAAVCELSRVREKTWDRTHISPLGLIPNVKVIEAIEKRVEEAAQLLIQNASPGTLNLEEAAAATRAPVKRQRKQKAGPKKGRL